ncbi:hypothetical protein Rhe02_52360 [Rhizocola hellebori]|uniref:Sulfatase-modifying factor enzyme-like domain-containing protein n=1 Tax=Rhizocola hellebori TaxID=1392758 RepID=A0A8J3QAH7_9ACTN|nr:SUMF1/EgtB/PvdO family nonheme iron enzyme [Rhizocola hellebori]GIH07169.1 hypothetical protein Rhe02_52360 [Rhizocola hellebori]
MTLHVLDEIDDRVAVLRARALSEGVEFLPPLLALGTSERVGSNWFCDTMRPAMTQHNEPLRQQLGRSHPLSAVNPQATSINRVSRALLGPLGWHWLVTFAVSKYGSSRQLVKETNLFFATETLLRLFPDSPVLVLSRSPLGVASSFLRSGLYERWDYAARYRQMVAVTLAGPHARLVPADDPVELIALTRLVVLNALLLAVALQGRSFQHVPYEKAVLNPGNGQQAVGELAAPDQLRASSTPGGGDDTFSTGNSKTELLAHLTPAEAALVMDVTAATLIDASQVVTADVLEVAAGWLQGSEHYQLADVPKLQSGRRSEPVRGLHEDVTFVYCRGVEWRNLLVSNAEICGVLNHLHQSGLPNTVRGTHLLVNEMPHERGGRLHFDQHAGRWTVSPGYENHPVYWVTWIGAAVFAAVNSARLPAHEELRVLAAGSDPSNHSYDLGDVSPVTQAVTPLGIHHAVGNVQVWCADGPVARFDEPAQRWIHGAAWNTPATSTEVNRMRSRHLLGSSRGVGIRLVRDPSAPFTGPTVQKIAKVLDVWVEGLTDRGRALSEIDRELLDQLSQADIGLWAHV